LKLHNNGQEKIPEKAPFKKTASINPKQNRRRHPHWWLFSDQAARNLHVFPFLNKGISTFF